MSDQEKKVRLEGIVEASRYDRDAPGKQFLGAAIKCSDGKVWVIAYGEQSPFHAFAGRQVVASGERYSPDGQALIGWRGATSLGHFRVSSMRPVEVTDDLELREVGAEFDLRGRFWRGKSDTGKSLLRFVTEKGDTFEVANNPAGASVGRSVKVQAYPVQPSPLIQKRTGQYLWIICPYSGSDIGEWRGRRS